MDEQEKMIKMNMIEQEARSCEEKMQAIDQQVLEMQAAMESVSALKNGKNREILANLGKGIFAEARISGEELRLNVGNGVIIKKTPDETLKVIEEQIGKLSEGKNMMLARMQELQEEAEVLFSHREHKHECGENCGHHH